MRTFDPRAKLVAALVLGALIVAGSDLPRLGIIALLLAVLIVAERLIRPLWALARGLALMLALTFGMSWLALGLDAALWTTLHFATLVALFFVFFQTTLPEDLGNSLVQWRVPYAFAFILTGGMQFAPVMARKAEAIAGRASGLMEPLRLIECDATRLEAILRSDEPTVRGGKRSHYELRLDGKRRAILRRFQAGIEPTAKREQIPFTLTHEVLGHFVDNVAEDLA